MPTLILTDSPRKGESLRRAFGDDITVREIPLPLFKLPRGLITITDTGYPKLDAVTKHIGELRKLASRFDLVLVVLPPVPFWYEIGWSLRRALAGLSTQVLFYYPADLAFGLDCLALDAPPRSTSSFVYACDSLIEQGVLSLLQSKDTVVPVQSVTRPMARRSVLCCLAYLARMYETQGFNSKAFFQSVCNLGQTDLVFDTSLTADVARVAHVDSVVHKEPIPFFVAPDELPTTATLVRDLIRRTSVPAVAISKALDLLYCFGCISYYETDSVVPDDVHTWATTALLDTYGVNPELLGVGPTSPGVYATGISLSAGSYPEASAVLEYITQRTLQAYCQPITVSQQQAVVTVVSGETRHAIPVEVYSSTAADWWLIGDSLGAVQLPSVDLADIELHVQYKPHFTVSVDSLVSSLQSLGVSSRDILTGLYYINTTGLGYVTDRDVSISSVGYYLYAFLSRAFPSLFVPELFSLGSALHEASTESFASAIEMLTGILTDPVSVCVQDILPSLASGINIDPIMAAFHSDTETFGTALHEGSLIPLNTGVSIEYLCPCGCTSATTLLGTAFSTLAKCDNPDCTENPTPISLLPTPKNLEDTDGPKS